MKKSISILITLLFTCPIWSQGYKPGDTAIDFSLMNINDKTLSLNDFKNAKGFIVIFTCNHCPYAVAYEDRIIELDKEFSSKGYPVIAINPNDTIAYPSDSFVNMKLRATEKGFTFPYLLDHTQNIAKTYGATRTPQVYILQKENSKLVVKYTGTIDDNYQDEQAVKERFVAQAVNSLLNKTTIQKAETKAIGCSIKWK